MAPPPPARFYLTGRVAVEGRTVLDQAELPGRQGLLALVYLVVHRHRPVPVTELAAALWGDDLPPSWEPSLRAVVSKLRSALGGIGVEALRRDAGCYQALLGGAWVDIEEAANAVDRAEGAHRRGDLDTAWSEATVATAVTRRPLLSGEDLPWIADLRAHLEHLAIRALDVLTGANLERGDHRLAAVTARELVSLAPFRESGYRQLIRAEAAAGDPAEALRVFERLREVLTVELGVEPAEETREALSRALSPSKPPPAASG